MLLVRAKAGPSRIHGMGLISHEFILAETVIWRFMPGFDVRVSEVMLEKLSYPAKEQLLYYAYFHKKSGTFILSSDDDRFTNHSEEANTKIVNDNVVACRDIAPGEEITANYRELTMFNLPEGEPDWLATSPSQVSVAG